MSGVRLLAACVCVVGFAPPQKHVRGPSHLRSTIQYPKNPLESVLSLGAPRSASERHVRYRGRRGSDAPVVHGRGRPRRDRALVDALDDRRGADALVLQTWEICEMDCWFFRSARPAVWQSERFRFISIE